MNTNNYIDWISDEIKYICLTHKKRVAGSVSERACGDYMANQLTKWSDTVVKEDFTLHPNAYAGGWALQSSLGMLSIICFLFSVWFSLVWLTFISVLFTLMVLVLWVFETALYRQCTDFLYTKSISQNVMAVRKAENEAKQRIIICGHADAAYNMPLMQRFSVATILVMSISAIAGLFICLIIGVLTVFANLPQQMIIAFCIFQVLMVVPRTFFLLFVDWGTVVDGANDNLTGSLIGMSILKEMAEENHRFTHTDVCCLITGGEESGLRGAFAYAKANKQELLDTNSIVIAVDTIHEKDHLMVYPRGIYHTQKNNEAVCELLRAAGKECGVTLPDAGFYFGATDAEAFSRNKIKAAALCAVRHKPTSYYHTVTDTWDNLDKDCLTITRDILKTSVELFDKGINVLNNPNVEV